MPRVAPFLATGIYRQTRDVAIRVGRGRAEYAKRVYGASCVRVTAADVQKCWQYFPEKRIDQAHATALLADRRGSTTMMLTGPSLTGGGRGTLEATGRQ